MAGSVARCAAAGLNGFRIVSGYRESGVKDKLSSTPVYLPMGQGATQTRRCAPGRTFTADQAAFLIASIASVTRREIGAIDSVLSLTMASVCFEP